MADMGFRTFQEMIGRTDKVQFKPSGGNNKAELLDFSNILANALEFRPNTNIKGGSIVQNFEHEKRLVRT